MSKSEYQSRISDYWVQAFNEDTPHDGGSDPEDEESPVEPTDEEELKAQQGTKANDPVKEKDDALAKLKGDVDHHLELNDILDAAPPELTRVQVHNAAAQPGARHVNGSASRRATPAGSTTNPANAAQQDTLVSAVVVQEIDEEVRAKVAEEQARDNILKEMVQGEVVGGEEGLTRKMQAILGVTGLAVVAIVVTLVVILADGNSDTSPLVTDYDFLVEILSPISGEGILLNETSSQNSAFNWLLDEDDFFNQDVAIQTLDESLLIERFALAVFYFSTQGEAWSRDLSFLSSNSVCEWPLLGEDEIYTDGIACNNDGRVTDVTLSAVNLNGTIPSELSQLSFLRNIKIDDNNLYGTLPEALGELDLLASFAMEINLISGPIPESFVNLDNLESINFSSNSLSGPIPEDLFQLESLQQINLGWNQLTGTIPEFPARGKLEGLSLEANLLEGTIPESLWTNTEIISVSLYSNTLTGTLSKEVGNLEKMFLMYVDGNQLEGTLPTELGLLKEMQFMWLNFNKFSGTLPTELGQLGKFNVISEIVLNNLDLTGTIPTEISLLESIFTLDLAFTSFSGDVDPSFCDDLAIPKVTMDCGPEESPEAVCSCCTACCNDITEECESNVPLICERLGEQVMAPGVPVNLVINQKDEKPAEAICECSEIPASANETSVAGKIPIMRLTCNDGDNCEVCTPDGSICGRRVNFGFDWDENGIWTHQRMGFQYTKGLDDFLLLEFDVSSQTPPYPESVYLNGEKCNQLQSESTCTDGNPGFEVDCSNVQEGAIYDQCEGLVENAGVLEFFTPRIYGVSATCGENTTAIED